MVHTSSYPSTLALVAGSAALLVAGLGVLSTYQSHAGSSSSPSSKASSSSSSRSNTPPLRDVDDEDDNDDDASDDFITETEVAKIFDRLFLEMQAVFSQLMQQIQQLQMAGQMIPEAQLKAVIRSEMERALLVKQKLVLEQFDIDYDCLEEATWEFLEKEDEHPKVRKAVERFQKMWENSTGDEVAGWRPGGPKATSGSLTAPPLSAERTVELADAYFSALTHSMRELVDKYRAAGQNLQDPSVQQALNFEFAQGASDAGEAALAQHNITLKQFESSVKLHSSNPTVGRSLAMLQMKQQQDLMALGVA